MKFAQVGYGSQGQGKGKTENGYTYIVNDNVKVGTVLQPSVIHYKNGKIFATTGIVVGTENSLSTQKGQKVRRELFDNGKTVSDLAEALTGKELGVSQGRTAKGTFTTTKGTRDALSGEYKTTAYERASRGGNILLRKQDSGLEIADTEKAQGAVETFESYSKKFMGN